MKPFGSGAAPQILRLAALALVPAFMVSAAAADTPDFLYDEGQRKPEPLRLSAEAERQARAMAYFVTGVFDEESAGPERALESYKRVLELDPGFTKLAIEVAYDHLRRGQSADAIGVLKDAIKAVPKDPEPALALSSIYLRHLRKPDLAAKYAQTALQTAPQSFAPYEALWEIAQAQGESRKATQVLDRALKSESADPTFWLQLAEFYAGTTDQDPFTDERTSGRIGACLEKATTLAGGDAEAIAKVADFYILNRQYEKAAPLYEKAYKLKSWLPSIREKLAGTLIQVGRAQEAVPVLEEVISNNPLDLKSYDQLAELYRANGEFRKALRCVEQGLIIERTNWQRHREQAVLLLAVEEYEKAVERLEEARRMFPQVAFFTYLQAIAYRGVKKYEESLEAFERAQMEAANLQPDLLSGEFYMQFGMTAEQAGRYVRAAEMFKRAIEVDPSNAADACNALGYMWADRNENLDEAERLIRQALEHDPKNGAYIDSLGWVLFRQGKYQDSLTELLRAAESMPDPDPVVFDHIGDAYEKLGRTSEAVLYWQKSNQLDPGNKDVLAKIDRFAERVAQKPDGGASQSEVAEQKKP